jgi:hypothetical protein
LSGMACSTATRSSVASIAPSMKASEACATGTETRLTKPLPSSPYIASHSRAGAKTSTPQSMSALGHQRTFHTLIGHVCFRAESKPCHESV